MSPAKTDPAPALAAAYAKLLAAGRPVTVRGLREAAGVATDAAAAWLRQNAPAPETPAVPTEALAPALSTVWAAAWTQARDAVAEDQAATLHAAREAEARALADAETAQKAQAGAEARATEAEAALTERDHTIAALRQELSVAQQELVELRRDLRDAERAQASAEATAVTLRDTLAGFQSAARPAPRAAEPTSSSTEEQPTTRRSPRQRGRWHVVETGGADDPDEPVVVLSSHTTRQAAENALTRQRRRAQPDSTAALEVRAEEDIHARLEWDADKGRPATKRPQGE